jgi:tetratricopeptide (TPR) repeat protein
VAGEDSFAAAFVQSEIGELFYQQRELGRAEDEFLTSLAAFRKLHGLKDPQKIRMAFVLSRLALLREEQGKDEEAVRLALESVDLGHRRGTRERGSSEPRADQERLQFCTELALKLVNRQSYRAAIPLWEKAVALAHSGSPEVRRCLPNTLWQLALTRLASAEPDGYAAVAADILREFAKDRGPDHDLFVTRLVVLTGSDPAACTVYLKTREKRLADGTASSGEYRLAGAIAYRRKDYREAVRLIEQGAKKCMIEEMSPDRAYERLFLAVACHRLGEKKRAAENLHAVLHWLDRLDQNGGVNPATRQPVSWDSRMELALLRREAERLFGKR